MDFPSRAYSTRSHIWALFLSLFTTLIVQSLLVATYSIDQANLKHNSIAKFNILKVSDIKWSKSISTRNTDKQPLHDQTSDNFYDPRLSPTTDKSTQARKIQLSSLGINLILSKSAHLTTKDFLVVSLDSDGKETEVPYNRDDYQVLNGFVEGDAASIATASFNKIDNLMTAQIKTNEDTIVVEPSYLHKEGLIDSMANSTSKIDYDEFYKNSMIAYKLRDHKQFNLNSTSSDGISEPFKPNELCGAVNTSDPDFVSRFPLITESPVNPELEDVFKIYNPRGSSRPKRGIEYLSDYGRDKSRCTLHLVADYLFYKHVGRGDMQTTINYLLALINRINQIYLPTVWKTGDESDNGFTNIGFTVQNITIHQEYTRTASDHYNMHSNKTWAAKDLLEKFSKYSPPRHYCLAHLFTYRQFDTPVLGLAYVASTRHGTIGGICSPTQQKDDAFYKHNTGISTSRGIGGETLITRQADLVVAHELGHNLGAEHDSNDCRPAPSKGGAYLMHPFAVLGFDKNNKVLSNCSRLSIGRVIRRKASTCFVEVEDHVCGNGVVEDDEECDGGNLGLGHHDPCCDSSCRLTPGSQCSDRHSWCCLNCQVRPAAALCRDAEPHSCKQASYCDGRSSDCPASAPMDEDTPCVGRGLCRRGECESFCEAKLLYSCLCTSPVDACKLCCKTSPNGTCVPYDHRAPHLQDGVLCYRGVCEKGRCEQPVQDVMERLWGILEDVNFSTLVRLARDNIIIVILAISIPLWCLICRFINEYDKRVKRDVINAIMNNRKRRKELPSRSPFLPRLFVGDEISNSNSNDDIHLKDEARVPLKPPHTPALPQGLSLNGNNFEPQISLEPGFRPPIYGFQLPEGEEVVFEPRGSIALNSIQNTHDSENISAERNDEDRPHEEQKDHTNSYSTEV